MAMFYPRKQTVLIFVICAFAVGVTSYYVRSASPSMATEKSASDVVTLPRAADIQPVSANNDWQKQFVDTSAPNAFKTTKTTAKPGADAEQLTATEILSRQFMTKYMQLQQAGLATNQQTVDDITNQLVASSVGSVTTPKPYALTNIRMTEAADQETLKSYVSSINAILHAYVPDADHNEAVIAEQALDKGDMSILKDIDALIANYQAGIKALLSMTAPRPLASYHVALLNGMSMSLFNAQSFRHVDSDPVKGMAALGNEISNLQAMSDAMTGIKEYLTQAGIPMT